MNTRWRSVFAGVYALAVTVSARSEAQGLFSSHRSFSLYAENDAIFGSSDSSYTNGVRVSWEFLAFNRRLGQLHRALSLVWVGDVVNGKASLPSADRECAPREGRVAGTATGKRLCGSLGFSIAQTMYTPSDIVTTSLQPQDRPYAGMLYASAFLTELRHRLHSTTEVQLGVIGPWSSSESTQSLAHWTWAPSSAKPRGWEHQLRNAVQIGIVNTYAYRPKFLEWCATKFGCNGLYSERRIVDVTPRAEGVLGTHMTRVSGGGVVRLGYGFPDVVSISRIPTTAGRSTSRSLDPWINVFWSIDQRAVLGNAFISGTPADRGNGGWRDVREVALKRGVSEDAWGVSLGFASASLTAQVVRRSAEYSPGGGSHRFGAVSFMLHTPASAR